MSKAAFVGFGEVNTPIDIIIRKCEKAAAELEAQGEELIKVYPVTDDYEEKDGYALEIAFVHGFCLLGIKRGILLSL